MPVKESFFQQSNTKLVPAKSEIFASAVGAFSGFDVEMHVIGNSHHLSVDDTYTERLACDTDISKQLSDKIHYFQQATRLGTYYSTLWQEIYDEAAFSTVEKSYLHEPWHLVHCFRENTAFTGIRITDKEIQTIHSYPEYFSLVFSKTRLVSFNPGES